MTLSFPIEEVQVALTNKRPSIKKPIHQTDWFGINQEEFYLDIPEVGCFYAKDGNKVSVFPYPEASKESLYLYLHGSVYGAILHQRKIMPLHGSSFVWQNQGILLCGESGAGKSSLTTAFCQDGSKFVSDDVSPILFEENSPQVWALSSRIKLWKDSLKQLEQSSENLSRILPDQAKFYFPMPEPSGNKQPLHHILMLEVSPVKQVQFQPLESSKKFEALRNEIYRWEFLQGMPETEAAYLPQLLHLAESTTITKVLRPRDIPILEMKDVLERWFIENFT
ncbi:ATP-binding protein [Pararhodonellum marinum]|uniref:ATP-binding protein n=1 Tax=Pararhodonellum marinum TaxID=2755358 RepID=UPI0018906B17|nr:ATP-binding protein [Pararhodonellum marinum]